MRQVLIVFNVREGSEPEVARLAAAGPPFDPKEAGFKRLAVYLSQREAIFVLEGEDPQWGEDDLVDDFLQPALRERLDEWRKLADVKTWPAQPIFFWEASADE